MNNVIDISERNKGSGEELSVQDLVKVDNNQVVTSSRDIAEVFGRKHKSVLDTIRSTLSDLGDGQKNQPTYFYENEYKDSMNRSQTEYLMNRDGFTLLAMGFTGKEAMQFKIEYINAFNRMEKDIEQLQSTNTELTKIGKSNKDDKQRQYEIDRANYGWQNIRLELEKCDYRTIEDKANDIVDFHANKLLKRDRAGYKTHQEANDTEYKQIVRDRVLEVIEDVRAKNTGDVVMTMVTSSIRESLLKDKLSTNNRSYGSKLSYKERQIQELSYDKEDSFVYPEDYEFVTLSVAGFSNNYMYQTTDDKVHRSYAYNQWIKYFPSNELPSKDYWEVDWNKPIQLFLHYTTKEDVDVRNLDKSMIDQIITREYGLDDNMVDSAISKRVGTVDDFYKGKTGIYIKNV